MLRSLVGSEMCIRDRYVPASTATAGAAATTTATTTVAPAGTELIGAGRLWCHTAVLLVGTSASWASPRNTKGKSKKYNSYFQYVRIYKYTDERRKTEETTILLRPANSFTLACLLIFS